MFLLFAGLVTAVVNTEQKVSKDAALAVERLKTHGHELNVNNLGGFNAKFKFDNCDAPLPVTLSSLVVTPDPITLGDNMTVSASLSDKYAISGRVKPESTE
jgi:hypothetical protein